MFGLCLELGFAHPDVLAAQLSARQLTEWIAYKRIRHAPSDAATPAAFRAAFKHNIVKATTPWRKKLAAS